jgi:energy-coupling factor transporter ATP-binding protein EcfA2
MVTQLHLAVILAIDARLLVLDEPTLGLDLLYRRQFYDTLLNDYYDEERTILLTTHQVEEIENLLTDVIFIQRGKIALDSNRDIDGVPGLLDKANMIDLLALPSLWIGVAVAALMLYVTIRIRRHRDDT